MAKPTVLMMLAALALGSGVANAQDTGPFASSSPRALSGLRTVGTPGPLASAASAASNWPGAASASGGGGQKGTWIGLGIGAATGVAITYWAASNYGENAEGEICTRCFVQWGAFAIPAGAAIGAVIGNLIGRTSSPQRAPRVPQTYVAPLVGRHAGGVRVAVRY